MKKRGQKKFTGAAALLFAGVVFFAGTSAPLCVSAAAAEETKEETGEESGTEMETKKSYDVSRLSLPESAVRLVIVEAEGLRANVSMYAKEETQSAAGETDSYVWTELVNTDDGLIGRAGLGKLQEGDEKTPVGLYLMNTPFGIAGAEAGFPDNYLQVDGRYYWDGDSDSEQYNRLVNTDTYTAFDRSKSEHLAAFGAVYNYCIDTGYNPEGTPHKGSALFLHCSSGNNTAGCIAIPEAEMIKVLQNYREGGTYILIDEKGNFAQYETTDTADSNGEEINRAEGPCVLSGSCG